MTKWQQLVREKMLVNAYDVLRLKFVVHCEKIKFKLFFKKMGQPWPLFHLFPVFSNKHYNFLQQIYVKKCSSSIWCQDSNPRPLECESPPITTRPGLPPNGIVLLPMHR